MRDAVDDRESDTFQSYSQALLTTQLEENILRNNILKKWPKNLYLVPWKQEGIFILNCPRLN